MKTEQLSGITKWFDAYVQTFANKDGKLHSLLQLKVDHSKGVGRGALSLAHDLEWSCASRNTAEALGLLHDVGRFSQFSEYKTFSDSSSVDHGEYGGAVVAQAPWLRSLPSEEQSCILDGIRYHNAKTIPDALAPGSIPFLKLLRDADKLDILKVVLQAVEDDGFRELLNMLPNVTLDRAPSLEVVNEIITRRGISLQNVRTLGDFLLMQLSWVYDFNYTATFQRFQDRSFLSRLLGQLSGNSEIQVVVEDIRQLVRNRLSNKSQSVSEEDCVQ